MDLSDDLPPPRRPLFFPVVLATIFLTVIGLSAGWTLGARHQRLADSAQVQSSTPAPTVATTPAAEPCRRETQDAARGFGVSGQLSIVLLLRTRFTAVWICEDSAGRLYYHANRGGEDAKWIEGQTALFMAGVRRDGDGYAVNAADGTAFSINSQRLRIVHVGGKPEIQPAAN